MTFGRIHGIVWRAGTCNRSFILIVSRAILGLLGASYEGSKFQSFWESVRGGPGGLQGPPESWGLQSPPLRKPLCQSLDLGTQGGCLNPWALTFWSFEI